MWKTIAGQCIYQSSHASVHQNMGYRWLKLNSKALQTLINRRHLEKPGLPYINHLVSAVRLQPADTCLLGLGGAGVAHALSPYLGHKILAVESELEVINIAATYFKTCQLSNLTITHQDAHFFVQHCPTQYQHLLVDVYDATGFPHHCNNFKFFKDCRRLLLPEGVLSVNLANWQEQQPIYKLINDIFKQSTVCLPVKKTSNMVILASQSSSILPLLDRMKRVKNISWDSKWGWVAF